MFVDVSTLDFRRQRIDDCRSPTAHMEARIGSNTLCQTLTWLNNELSEYNASQEAREAKNRYNDLVFDDFCLDG